MSNSDIPGTPDSPDESGAAPQPPQYQPPVVPGSETPSEPAQPQAPQYAPPAQPQQPYGQQPQYGAPQQPQYGAPQQPYGQQPGYGAPQQPAYNAPQPGYGAPQQPGYAAQQQYAQPGYQAAPNYGMPGAPGPGEPFDGAVDPEDLSRPLYGASFGQAVKRYFRSYAKFTGRSSRSEYWWVALFLFLISFIPGILMSIGFVTALTGSAAGAYSYSYGYGPGAFFAALGAGSGIMVLGFILLLVIGLGLIVPNIALAWRRLHDGNYPGPLYFLSLIPYVGGLILFVFMLLPPNPEGRRFGN